MEASYNDIQGWRFTEFPSAMGAAPGQYAVHSVHTRDALVGLLGDEEFASASRLQVVEVHLPADDAPWALKAMTQATAARN